jgi:hypothetical protein
VADFCTCGAELPPDARFCHRCGKPQREEDIPELAPPRALPEAERQAPKPPPAIDFRNRLALRAAFLAALLANLLTLFPYLFLAAPLWLVGAGFLAVHVYLRRSGQALSVASGARVGWLTGVFSFAMKRDWRMAKAWLIAELAEKR